MRLRNNIMAAKVAVLFKNSKAGCADFVINFIYPPIEPTYSPTKSTKFHHRPMNADN